LTKQSRLVVASQSLNKLASVNDRTQVPNSEKKNKNAKKKMGQD